MDEICISRTRLRDFLFARKKEERKKSEEIDKIVVLEIHEKAKGIARVGK